MPRRIRYRAYGKWFSVGIFAMLTLFIPLLVNLNEGRLNPRQTSTLLTASAAYSSDPVGDEWPMFRGSLNHTGQAVSEAMTTGGLRWNYTTGSAIESSPAVVGGCVFIGSEDKNLYCLNATTGEQIWNYSAGNLILSSPAVAGGCVYFGTYGLTGIGGSNLYCLNATTGEQLWNYPTDIIISSPAVAGGFVYFGSDDLFCLNATTGAQAWNYTATISFGASSPAVTGGYVYVGGSVYLYCLNATTGAQAWNYTTGASVSSSPAVAGGYVYVGSDDGKLYCLNAITGGQAWNYTTGRTVYSSPAVAGGYVYVGSEDGKLYCLNATTGAQVWNYTTGNWVDSSPAVAGGCVYVGSLNGILFCLNATTGGQVWNYTTGDELVSSPAMAGGYVYIGSWNGLVYCLPTMFTPPPTPTPVNYLPWFIIISATGLAVLVCCIFYLRRPKHSGNGNQEELTTVRQELLAELKHNHRIFRMDFYLTVLGVPLFLTLFTILAIVTSQGMDIVSSPYLFQVWEVVILNIVLLPITWLRPMIRSVSFLRWTGPFFREMEASKQASPVLGGIIEYINRMIHVSASLLQGHIAPDVPPAELLKKFRHQQQGAFLLWVVFTAACAFLFSVTSTGPQNLLAQIDPVLIFFFWLYVVLSGIVILIIVEQGLRVKSVKRLVVYDEELNRWGRELERDFVPPTQTGDGGA